MKLGLFPESISDFPRFRQWIEIRAGISKTEILQVLRHGRISLG